MKTAVNEVNNDKTKVRDEFIFRSVSLVCFTTATLSVRDSADNGVLPAND